MSFSSFCCIHCLLREIVFMKSLVLLCKQCESPSGERLHPICILMSFLKTFIYISLPEYLMVQHEHESIKNRFFFHKEIRYFKNPKTCQISLESFPNILQRQDKGLRVCYNLRRLFS